MGLCVCTVGVVNVVTYKGGELPHFLTTAPTPLNTYTHKH